MIYEKLDVRNSDTKVFGISSPASYNLMNLVYHE